MVIRIIPFTDWRNAMLKLCRWISGSVVLGLSLLVAGAQAGEQKVPLGKVPKAVLAAVKARFPDAKLVRAEKETEKGKTVYEIAINNKNQKIEVTLTPKGKITEIEKQIAAKAMPAGVTKALKAKYPEATYKRIEEVFKVKKGKEKLAYYEVLLVTKEDKKLEVSVTRAGKILKEEDKSKEKDS
jgi:uncharacterized membrane protein YkoI